MRRSPAETMTLVMQCILHVSTSPVHVHEQHVPPVGAGPACKSVSCVRSCLLCQVMAMVQAGITPPNVRVSLMHSGLSDWCM
jgi:hypothetical protein